MKKLLVIIALACTTALTVNAGEEAKAKEKEAGAKKPELTAEQKALKKAMIEKYDTNKNGKLTKEETSAMTPEEKTKWDAAFPPKKKDAPKTEEPKKEETK